MVFNIQDTIIVLYFFAGGGVRSIADINASDDLSNYYNKTQTYSQTETNNLLNNKANTGVLYSKSEDDTLLLLKADKTQLIDSFTKIETNNLLNSKTDNGVSNTKSEDEAFLLLKADKTKLIDSYIKSEDDVFLLLKAENTQLIDSYTKTETNNLQNSKANTEVSYTKEEDDALLLLKADKTQLIDSYAMTETNNLLNDKANQSTTCIKIETDQLISQIDTGNVDLSSYYTKTKTDELLDEKANTTDLSNYMTLDTAQTINANKIFNNACRFVSSIDGMSTVTGSSFVKSGADDTVVLLGASGTKPISEFAGAPTDLSNYCAKTQTYSQTDTNNKFVRLKGSIQQTITRRLKYVSPFDCQDETQDPVANTYLTMSEIDAKLTNAVTANITQSITGAKTFNSKVNAAGFAKIGKDDTLVLLTGGGDRLLSSFGGIEDLTSSAFSSMNGAVVQNILIRIANLYIFSLLAYGGNYNVGIFNPYYLVQDDTAIATYIPFPNSTIDKRGYVMITHSTDLITLKSNTNTYIQCASATQVK
ncbi:MAG: hypothetical protein EZS28_001567 [Streblomastix strix]|uniref:Uncharacterized protein n=1 Tax=Streblomastix strix TaxID=222440 RepID=A0A5J4X8G5_9EUKA|nr:MAG: hypothetical protein EZS28_001567 [Streblomastix strix]